MSGTILIVDDDERFARTLARALRRAGYESSVCSTPAEARAIVTASDIDVVVIDYQLPNMNGLALMGELQQAKEGAVFIIATAYPDVDVAVDAMRRGAFDYVAKAADLRECVIRVERATEVARLRKRMAEATHTDGPADAKHALLGDSTPMKRLRGRLSALKDAADTTVLVTGETGTGKGVVARMVHAHSRRAYEPFVAVDCTTIAPTLVETELFGHEKGAFSGAVGTKTGRVEAAGRGTLFLDEVGELPLPMQAKLLRLLEEREFTRVGGTKARGVDARIITATNRNLEREVQAGAFRADLRYRLEVFVVELPPLRTRGDDIFLLTAHFAREHARTLGREEPRLHADVIQKLPGYPFPGNVRQLRNMVQQAVLLSEGDELTLADFPVLSGTTLHPPAATTLRPAKGGPQVTLEDIRRQHDEEERGALTAALQATGGNVTAAARHMGLSRYQLIRRLDKHGMR